MGHWCSRQGCTSSLGYYTGDGGHGHGPGGYGIRGYGPDGIGGYGPDGYGGFGAGGRFGAGGFGAGDHGARGHGAGDLGHRPHARGGLVALPNPGDLGAGYAALKQQHGYEPMRPDGAPHPAHVSGGAGACCCSCLVAFGAVLAVVLWVLLRVGTAECTLESLDVRLVLPSNAKALGEGERFDRATELNTFLRGLELDLLGVWWMDGNAATAEQLVSFAGAEGDAPYPATVLAPFNLQRRWTRPDSFVARAVVALCALTERAEAPSQFTFTNNSYADVVPIADVFAASRELFGFRKISADEWERVDNYILRRVVNADGTAGPFWDNFISWYTKLYPSGRVLLQTSDNTCTRRCQYLLPCFMCNVVC